MTRLALDALAFVLILGTSLFGVALLGRFATPRPASGALPPRERPVTASFAADTWVSTPSGMKPIQEIVTGQMIHSWDFDEHRIVARRVRMIHRRERPTVRLTHDGGKLDLTPDHRLWSASRHQWRRADELKRGEILGAGAWHWVWRFAPGLSRVTSVEVRPKAPVYSIDLHLADNYLVGPDYVIASDYLPAATSNPVKEAPP